MEEFKKAGDASREFLSGQEDLRSAAGAQEAGGKRENAAHAAKIAKLFEV